METAAATKNVIPTAFPVLGMTNLSWPTWHQGGRSCASATSAHQESDLLEVRIAIETTAASLAAVRASPGELDEIAMLSLAHQRASITDPQELLGTDEEFHSAVVRASHNVLLEHLYQTLVPRLRDYRRTSAPNRAVHHRSANDHNQVVLFLRRHDEVGARMAMTTHLLGLYNDLAGDDTPGSATLMNFVGVDDAPLWNRDG